MKKSAFLLLTTISLFAQEITGRVVGVHDGDTLTILDNSKKQHKIRLAQIDAPELSQDFGRVSKQNLSNICFGKDARAKVEATDRYQRTVAVVYCDGIEANLKQVRDGLAWVYKQYATDGRYFAMEREAKNAKRGVWSKPNPTPPWEYRRDKRSH